MASDAVPIKASGTPSVQAIQAPEAATDPLAGGKSLPSYGTKMAARPASTAPPAKAPADLHALVAQLNKHLQTSGRPNQFRLDTSAGRKVIQEVNPDTQSVITEYPASEFAALAQNLGVSGLLVDTVA